jgi:hypothetical protein
MQSLTSDILHAASHSVRSHCLSAADTDTLHTVLALVVFTPTPEQAVPHSHVLRQLLCHVVLPQQLLLQMEQVCVHVCVCGWSRVKAGAMAGHASATGASTETNAVTSAATFPSITHPQT